MTYSTQFFADQTGVAYPSARAVLPDLIRELDVTSVVDVGCGVGAWAAVAKEQGCTVLGVDGHVEPAQCLVDEFERVDLSQGYDCSGWDLAVCLEVAEHLPEASSGPLVAGLCQARYVLFSGAHPGQGGVDHQNEQWGSWWESLFRVHGFEASNHLKWQHWSDETVADFYRENMLLFARPSDSEDRFRGAVDVLHPSRFGQWP